MALQAGPYAAEWPTAAQLAALERASKALGLCGVGSMLLGWLLDRRFRSWLAELPPSWSAWEEFWVVGLV